MFDYLIDSTGSLACLVNCRIAGNLIFCGATVFRGGLSGTIKVYNGITEFEIKLPDNLLSVATYQIRSSINDDLEVQIC
jgi:hypothetical protein